MTTADPDPTDPAPAPTTSSIVRRLGLVVAVVVVAALLLFFQKGSFDRHAFAAAIRAIRIVPPLVAIGTALGVAALQGLRWWYVTRPVLPLRYVDALFAVLVGNFLNTCLPARAGDVLRVKYLSRHAHLSGATLMGTELVDFWSDKCGWVPAFLLCLLFNDPPRWMFRAFLVMLAATATLIPAWLLLRRRLRRPRLASAAGWRTRLAAGLTANPPRRLALAGLLFGALPWIWEMLAIVLFARLSGFSLTPPQAFTVLTAFNLVIVVPLPGNLGLHEAASSFALMSFGVGVERAMAFAVLYHLSQLVPGMLGGVIAFARRRSPSLASSLTPRAANSPTRIAAP